MKRNDIIYTDAETFTPEEEITAENSTFATKGGETGKRGKGGAKRPLALILAILVAAAVLIAGYFIFLYEPATETEIDPLYVLSAEGKDALEEVKATISFADDKEILSADETGSIVYKFAQSVAECGKIKLKTGEADAFCVISANGDSVSLKKEEFFRFLEDGTPYAFDGENLFVNSILSLCGQEKIDLSLRALDGYDTDGDVVTSTGKPFLYPSTTRSNVKSITVKNQKTSFKVYRPSTSSSTFYIEGAEGVELNAEAFSYLVVNATYTCAEGKVNNPKDFSQYGLDGEGSTATVTVETLDGKTHKLIIGDVDSTGSYHYARYDGKEHVYLLLRSDVESTFAAGGEVFLTATLVYPISDTNAIYSIDQMVIYYRDLDQNIAFRLRRAMAASSNIVLSNEDADVATMLTDLKRLSGVYSDWTQDANFIGMGTKDGEAIQMAISTNRISKNGKYSLKIPFVRDEAKGAYLPESVEIYVCTDGSTFQTAALYEADTFSDQKNGTYKVYNLDFESKDPVKYIRIDIEGYSSKKLFVTDEIRIMAGDVDANPADAFIGLWMITTDEFVPDDRNYAYVNTTKYVEYLMSVCVLVGDEVVKIGIENQDLVDYGFGKWQVDENGNPVLNEETKEQDVEMNPAMQIHYVYSGYTMDILLSDPLEDGSRYAMSMITTTENGEEVKFVNPYIARVTLETAPWMEWEPMDYLSSSLLFMIIDDLDEMTFTFNGKDYNCVFGKDENGTVQSVTVNGKELDMDTFRKVYVSVINISRDGEYNLSDGEQGSEMLRIKIKSETKQDEIIFYRVTSTKAYYTIDGAGGYYTLTYDVLDVISRFEAFLAGETIK